MPSRLPLTDEDFEIISKVVMRRMAAWPTDRPRGSAWIATAARVASDYIEDGRRKNWISPIDLDGGLAGQRSEVLIVDDFQIEFDGLLAFDRLLHGDRILTVPITFEVNRFSEPTFKLPNISFFKERKPHPTARERREQLRGTFVPKGFRR